jgi:hypothetical protein
MFGCTTRPTPGGQLRMGSANESGLGVAHTGTLAGASIPAPNWAIMAGMNPTKHELVQMMLSADCRRQAAYRRLALTILGLDVRSLVQALPLTRERSN